MPRTPRTIHDRTCCTTPVESESRQANTIKTVTVDQLTKANTKVAFLFHDYGVRSGGIYMAHLQNSAIKTQTNCALSLRDHNFYAENPRPDDLLFICDYCRHRKPFPVQDPRHHVPIQRTEVSNATLNKGSMRFLEYTRERRARADLALRLKSEYDAEQARIQTLKDVEITYRIGLTVQFMLNPLAI